MYQDKNRKEAVKSSHRMNPGSYKLTAREYHSSPGVSKSMLDLLHPTPAHFLAGEKEQTDSMELGECLHSLLLEKEDRFHVEPEFRPDDPKLKWNNNAKVCQQWNEAHSDKPILKKSEAEAVRAMARSVHSHPWAGPALEGALIEQSLFVKDPVTGLLLRCRPDAIPSRKFSEIKPIIDVKTAASAEKESFRKAALKRRYHVQAGSYLYISRLLGMDLDSFIFVVVESKPPYLVATYDLDPADIREGLRIYQADLFVYKSCIESGKWPGYNTEPELLQLKDDVYG